MKTATLRLLIGLATIVFSASAQAQLVVSSEDGKQLRPGEASDSRVADQVTLIDLSQSPPQVTGTVEVATSLIGPPTAVAVAPDESFALVTAAQSLEHENIVKDDSVSVIDLSDPRTPRVMQTLSAGPGASGVAINHAADLALVANTGSDAISVFTISGGQLEAVGEVRMDYQSRPTDVAFTPDGKRALVVAQASNEIVELSVNGNEVRRTGRRVSPGLSPYGVTVATNGQYAYNTNLGGDLESGGPSAQDPRVGTISVIDLNSFTREGGAEAGATPEHIVLSPSGEHAVVVVANGSAAPEDSEHFNPHGLIKVFRVEENTLFLVGQAPSGRWCQGAAWSQDSSRILLQCAMDREIEVYDFDGTTLARDEDATITLDARPGSMGTAHSR